MCDHVGKSSLEDILLLGSEALYLVSEPVAIAELDQVSGWTKRLHESLMAYRERYGMGRAIAAPQIGISRRLIYMHVDGVETVIINPMLTFPDEETMLVWDDCMSFPGLLVQVKRFVRCRLDYIDRDLNPKTLYFEGDLSELIQHEYDHLEGILATMRAEDSKAFKMIFRP